MSDIPVRSIDPIPSETASSPSTAGLGSFILILATTLLMLGVVMVFSTTARLDGALLSDNLLHAQGVKQVIFAVVGLGLMWLTACCGYRLLAWRRTTLGHSSRFQPAAVLFLLVMVTLLITLVPQLGLERNGARRWLPLGPQNLALGFQPSELAKLAVVVFLAAWLADRPGRIRQFRRGLLPPAILVAVVAALVVIEDLGTAALIVMVGGLMLLAAGARWWHAALLSIPALAGFAVMIIIEPYRLERLLAHLDIWADPLGRGYHAIQSLVAIASGDWIGQGVGAGIQKYGYLPEAQTDFVFAMICEELGLTGGLLVLGLFAGLTLVGGLVARRAPDRHGQLLALGITLLIGLQAAMNIAVVTVTVPTKGISLPLVSAGGSGVLCYTVALGLLVAVAGTCRPAHSLPGPARESESY